MDDARGCDDGSETDVLGNHCGDNGTGAASGECGATGSANENEKKRGVSAPPDSGEHGEGDSGDQGSV